MKLKHHPDPSTILAYAAGSVNESFALLVAAHAESCYDCQAAVDQAETLAGGLLSELPPAEMEPGFAADFWKKADRPAETETPISPRVSPDGVPAALAPYLPNGLTGISWRMLVPGIQQYQLAGVESGAGSIRLLRIAPGVVIPEHSHLGSELTLILKGSYSDQTGNFSAGDISDVDSSVRHRPVVDSGQPCICLIATDQRLLFSSALNRMLQPFLGI